MLRQINSELVEPKPPEINTQTQSATFISIYMAAKEGDSHTLEAILKNNGSLNIYEDGSQYHFLYDAANKEPAETGANNHKNFPFHLKQLTPISLLAYQGENEAVDFLLSHGAEPGLAAYGYARANNIQQVDNIIDKVKKKHKGINLGIITLNYWAGNTLILAISGYNDANLLNNQDNLLSLFALSKYHYAFYKVIKKYNLYSYNVDTLYTKGKHLRHLITQYNLNFDQALFWATSPHLYFWFIDTLQAIEKGILPFQAMLIIATYVDRNLSITDVEFFYTKMTLDAYRIPIVNELKTKDLVELAKECNQAQSCQELKALLQEKSNTTLPMTFLRFFSGKSEEKVSTTFDAHIAKLRPGLGS